MTHNELFREIEEDLERQRYEELWKRYGGFVVGIAVLIILMTSGYAVWQSRKIEHNQKISSELIQYLRHDQLDPAKQAEELEKFAVQNPSEVAGILAKFYAATLEVKANNKEKAEALYDEISKDNKADLVFRQFADLMWVQLRFDVEDSAVLQARLDPLMSPQGPWRYSAEEYEAYIALRTGQKDKAHEFFALLSQEASVPTSIHDRAEAMLRYIGD